MSNIEPGRYRLELRSSKNPNRVENKYATAQAPEKPVKVERQGGNIQQQTWLVLPIPGQGAATIRADGMNTDLSNWHNAPDGTIILASPKPFRLIPFEREGPVHLYLVNPMDQPILPGGQFLVGAEEDILKAKRYEVSPEEDSPVWAFIPAGPLE